MQFMYVDSYVDANTVDFLVQTFLNQARYVNIDTTLTKTINYYAKSVLCSDNEGKDPDTTGSTILRVDADETDY